MIITKLIGGLGNQMFQYALGRHLAEKHHALLKLDISGFETYTLHKYALGTFNIQESFASPQEIKSLTRLKAGILKKIIRRIAGGPPLLAASHVIEQRRFHFSPDILELPDNIYLEGSWQSEKYFSAIADVIRREFTVKSHQTGKDKELAEQITAHESVSLHIRRADYISNPHTQQIHGVCDMAYYSQCIEQLSQKVNAPHFFIFSDDPEWACANMKLHYQYTIVDHNKADKNYEDLRLMSLCKYHIIANSTFSWWGAWLSPYGQKIVFAPQRWLKSEAYEVDDLIPAQWIKI